MISYEELSKAINRSNRQSAGSDAESVLTSAPSEEVETNTNDAASVTRGGAAQALAEDSAQQKSAKKVTRENVLNKTDSNPSVERSTGNAIQGDDTHEIDVDEMVVDEK